MVDLLVRKSNGTIGDSSERLGISSLATQNMWTSKVRMFPSRVKRYCKPYIYRTSWLAQTRDLHRISPGIRSTYIRHRPLVQVVVECNRRLSRSILNLLGVAVRLRILSLEGSCCWYPWCWWYPWCLGLVKTWSDTNALQLWKYIILSRKGGCLVGYEKRFNYRARGQEFQKKMKSDADLGS